MNFQLLRNSLVNQHHEAPQLTQLIDHAIRELQEGLSALARLGHHYHLVEGHQPDLPKPWPRLMYHLEAAPRGHLVFCQEDREWLGEGWFDTLDEAKHADGLGQQFRRGGIFPKRGLPALPADYEPTQLDKDSRNGYR